MEKSKFAQRKAERLRRDTRRDSKLCIDCGSDDLATNQNGKLSVKCNRCKTVATVSAGQKFSKAKVSADARQPVMRDWWDCFGYRGYLDTPEFRQYCVLVQQVIHKGCSTIGKQKRVLGERFMDRYHADALEALEGCGTIKLVRDIRPCEWKSQMQPKAPNRRKFNGSISDIERLGSSTRAVSEIAASD